MKVIICIDKQNGMLFNNRRQSQDCKLREKVFEIVGTNKLYMNEYSAKQFESNKEIYVLDDIFSLSSDDFYFIENIDIPIDKIEEMYIFNWNRLYPADKYFNFDLKKLGFKRIKKENFPGNSHGKITLEIYKR